MNDERTRLLRKRAGAWAFLAGGLSMSIIANVMHAEPSLIGRVIAAWPPVALLGTIELISRVPVHSRRMAALRIAAASLVAGIAAWVSYWHMAGVAENHGESVGSAHLFPLTVDGFVLVSSICLFEIAGKLRALTPDSTQSGWVESGPVGSVESGRLESTQSGPVDPVGLAESVGSVESGRLPVGVVGSTESTTPSRVVQLRRPMAIATPSTKAKSTRPKTEKTQEYVDRIKDAAAADDIDWPPNKTQIMNRLKIGKSYADAATAQIQDEGWTPQSRNTEVQEERVSQ